MQAKIEPNPRIRSSLYYNERKVIEGKAVRIGAENFLKGAAQLSHKDLLSRFRQRSSFNDHHAGYGIHFALKFGKMEEIGTERLVNVANRYMTEMGFEDQPYVVYQHHDAGHTHMHIVACGIRADGNWIRLEPKDYHASKTLCRKLEREFSLERSIRAVAADQPMFAVDHAQQVKYGEPGLKRRMSDVLNTVVDHYKYTSLDELNAILKQYNVEANPGLPKSHLRKVGGLLYHALDEDGDRVGVPIKASHFLLKPTLSRLEEKFEQNMALRETDGQRIDTAIQWTLAGRAPTWAGFVESLEQEGIDVVLSKKQDKSEQIFFVDHIKKTVFHGDGLGENYSAPALRNRCVPEEQLVPRQEQDLSLKI
jgi:hypothetical protein